MSVKPCHVTDIGGHKLVGVPALLAGYKTTLYRCVESLAHSTPHTTIDLAQGCHLFHHLEPLFMQMQPLIGRSAKYPWPSRWWGWWPHSLMARNEGKVELKTIMARSEGGGSMKPLMPNTAKQDKSMTHIAFWGELYLCQVALIWLPYLKLNHSLQGNMNIIKMF